MTSPTFLEDNEQEHGSSCVAEQPLLASQANGSATPLSAGLSATPCEFWLVWTKIGKPPKCRHNTRESAVEEAQRLALAHPAKTFIVMRGEEKYRVPGPPREDEPYRHPVRALLDRLGGRLEKVAALAEHYSFVAAALPADEDAMCLLGNAFVEIKDVARALSTNAPTSPCEQSEQDRPAQGEPK